jgi:hypothetical protein
MSDLFTDDRRLRLFKLQHKADRDFVTALACIGGVFVVMLVVLCVVGAQ